MGWLWSSEAPAAVNTTPAPQSQPDQAPPPPPSPAAQPPRYNRALTRDELAEKELQEVLAEINADASFQPTKPKYKRAPVLPSQDGSSPSPAERSSELTLEDSLYPTTMTCRDAFDSAFYCQSLGGQFNNLYRYGGIKSCSEHWKTFWFCMRTKSYKDEPKAAMIREHYKKRDLKYKVGPSSEDVWESREKMLGWGEAFTQTVEELLPGESDEEWNKRERKRREGRAAGTI